MYFCGLVPLGTHPARLVGIDFLRAAMLRPGEQLEPELSSSWHQWQDSCWSQRAFDNSLSEKEQMFTLPEGRAAWLPSRPLLTNWLAFLSMDAMGTRDIRSSQAGERSEFTSLGFFLPQSSWWNRGHVESKNSKPVSQTTSTSLRAQLLWACRLHLLWQRKRRF